MLVLDDLTNIVNQIRIYIVALIIENILNIILIVVHLIIIVLSIIDISKIIFKSYNLIDNI